MCEEREVVLCFCASMGGLAPFLEGKDATEFSIVGGPERVGTRGVVSSTSSRVRGWQSCMCRPWVVWCLLLAAEGRDGFKCWLDFEECRRSGRACWIFLKHSVPQVSE